MEMISLKKALSLAGLLSVALCGQLAADGDCGCENGGPARHMHFQVATAADNDCDECVSENDGPARHMHFSSHEVDIYDQTPDTVYKDADWPSRVEEYSDYLSR